MVLNLLTWIFLSGLYSLVAQEAQATEDFGPSITFFILPVLRIRIRDLVIFTPDPGSR